MPPNGQDFCCVSTCSNHRPESKDSSMYFFSFPANPEIRLLWMEAILKPEEYKICSKHFLRADIITADRAADVKAGNHPSLQENAVPIFFAPPDFDSEEIPSSPPPSDSSTAKSSESAALTAAADKSPDASATFVDVPTFTSHYDFVIKDELKEETMSTTPADENDESMQSDGFEGAGQVTGSVDKHDIPSTTSAEEETAGGASLEVAGSNVSQEEESHGMDGTDHTYAVNLLAITMPVFSLEEVNKDAQLSPLKAKSDALCMFQCDKCGKVVPRQGWWYHQNKGCLILKPLCHKCETCGDSFQCKAELLEHSRKRHNEKRRFLCEVCGKSYADKRKLTHHRTFHTNENLTDCQTCNKLINQPRLLNRHKYIAHGTEGQHKCDLCNKAFSMKCKLKVHRWIHTGERPYGCKVCGRSFRLPGFLSGHMRIHTQVKPFECSTCRRRFAMESSLQAHQNVHTGAKPYKCKTCGKPFASRSGLYYHNFTHGGIKPYACDTCAMRFTTNKKLRGHQWTHREYETLRKKPRACKKRYKCDKCNFSFSKKAWLTDHYAIHAEKKPYKCKLCGKVYRSYSSLSCHHKVTHVDKEFQCEDCGKKFYYKSRLVRHQTTAH